MITVLIVDDHDIVREGVKQIVADTKDIQVGGEARTGSEAMAEVRPRLLGRGAENELGPVAEELQSDGPTLRTCAQDPVSLP